MGTLQMPSPAWWPKNRGRAAAHAAFFPGSRIEAPAGTIDMRPLSRPTIYEGVGVEVLKKGFDRLVLVNCHGGGREMVFSVARRIFKKTQKPVVTMYPTFIYMTTGLKLLISGETEGWSLIGLQSKRVN